MEVLSRVRHAMRFSYAPTTSQDGHPFVLQINIIALNTVNIPQSSCDRIDTLAESAPCVAS